MICIEPAFFFFGALLFLTLPLPWVLGACFSALIHELCHLTAVLLLKGQVRWIRVGFGGAEIQADLSGDGCRLVAALAGPVGSLGLLLLWNSLPWAAVCGLIQGLFNLLPIEPLDGSVALRSCLTILCPERAPILADAAQWAAGFLVFFAALAVRWVCSWEHWVVFAGMIPLLMVIRRKIPCKQGKNAVQ